MFTQERTSFKLESDCKMAKNVKMTCFVELVSAVLLVEADDFESIFVQLSDQEDGQTIREEFPLGKTAQQAHFRR
jgi:hypothetical protein